MIGGRRECDHCGEPYYYERRRVPGYCSAACRQRARRARRNDKLIADAIARHDKRFAERDRGGVGADNVTISADPQPWRPS